MAVFVTINERAGVLVLVSAALVIWAVAFPESFGNAIDTVAGVLQGAFSGAQGAVS